ncbi:MAG: response regulator transcription factor [Desulfuromonas thiophila]|jgi:two-component system response regulator CpxR|nr:response regulator transcription factor [Desulfuromonas thiophila]MDY0399020.1 response regulator transcription factor [Desulfuromonas thiophila]
MTVSQHRILLVDDDITLCELLSDYLEAQGYQVTILHQGEEVRQRPLAAYDLMILDIMLPGINGLDILRQLRRHSTIPVLMLSARGDDVDRILGLELGADDYLAKPFNPRELLARIRAIQRRSASLSEQAELSIGDLSLYPGEYRVLCNQQRVELTAAEFALLHVLLRKAGLAISREQLSLQALSRELSPYDRSIDVHISNLRRKLGPTHDGHERIKTLRGHGYTYPLPDSTLEHP